MTLLQRRGVVLVFLVFAFAYFLSALIRAITATLAPTLTLELGLQARDLGLLSGGYFLGFAVMQLPLGTWLDRHGPKTVILCFLSAAVLGCAAFALATGFSGLLAARLLCGAGVSACLMAPLTGYRRWFDVAVQMRANSWMLMTGSLGMVTSTLPVQWLVPVLGWRALFWCLAALVLLSMALIAWLVPRWVIAAATSAADAGSPQATPVQSGYAAVWRHPYFLRLVPLGFFSYGGMIAMQTLWAGPWMVKVAGFSALEAATGLFWVNMAMLFTFWAWGLLNPWIAKRGLGPDRLMAWGMPSSMVALALIVAAGASAGNATPLLWVFFCMGSSFVTLSQPALALAFPPELAGRALSAYNLVVFAGVFVVQWGVGLGVDAFRAAGWSEVAAFQAAMGLFWATCLVSYGWFLVKARD
jgi:predicted MFS family arabinose efflux permease